MQPLALLLNATGRLRHRGAAGVIVWLGLAAACNAPRTPAPDVGIASPAEQPPAGTVEHLEGQVVALRAGRVPPARALRARAPVWADDTVTTAQEASVGIRLFRNGALWELQGGQTRRVDEGLAWRATRSAQTVALADHAEAPATAAAGRHSEQEAAQSAETAVRPEPAPVQAAKPAVKRRPSAQSSTSAPALVYKKRSTYDFDDDVVTGDLLKPDGEMPPPAAGAPPEPLPAKAAEHARLNLGEKMFEVDEPKPQAPAVLGALSPETVQRFLQPIRKQFQKCYEAALRQDPKAAGRLNIHIEFGADGRVAVVRAESATLPPQVGTCIENVIKRRPRTVMKSVSVQVPLVFKPMD